MSILDYALIFSLVAICLSFCLCIFRLIVGPSVVDRLLALDTLFLNSICLIIVFGLLWKTSFLFESALFIATFGFLSTAALARYFTTGHIID